jgi:hypothetical protein
VKTITADDAIRLLRETVAGKEDFIYAEDERSDNDYGIAECKYVKDGAPSCLIGQALSAFGVPVETLEDLDGFEESGSIDSDEVDEKLSEAGFQLAGMADGIFATAQRAQDQGKTWGDALARAEYEAGRTQ